MIRQEPFRRHPHALTIGTGRGGAYRQVLEYNEDHKLCTTWRYIMPRIDEQVLDSVFYLYPSKPAAEKRHMSGGTGFIIAVSAENGRTGEYYMYAVSNRHVVEGTALINGKRRINPSTWLRLNAHAGESVEPFQIDKWEPHPTADLTIGFMGVRNYAAMKYRAIQIDRLLTKDYVRRLDVGLGDDVGMVGRFIFYEGDDEENIPTLRTGVISAMPNEKKIVNVEGYEHPAYLIEMRSIGGYSGSPVLFSFPTLYAPPVTANPWPNFALRNVDLSEVLDAGVPEANLVVGLDAGMYQSEARVIDKKNKDADTQYRVLENTGFSVVIPAWDIADMLLTHPAFVTQRNEMDEETIMSDSKNPAIGAGANYEVQEIDPTDDFTEADFLQDLTKATRRIPQSDRETKETSE